MVKNLLPLFLISGLLQGAWAQKKSSEKATPAPTPMATSTPSPSKRVTLTQKDVAELVLKQGDKTKEVNLKYQQLRLTPLETIANYDWILEGATGYEFDNSKSVLSSGSTWPDNDYERYRTLLKLTKPFTTGTKLGLELERLSQKSTVAASVTNPPPSEQTADRAGLFLEQALWGNFFGVADRGVVNAAERTYEAQEILRADELEDVVLQAISQFWDTYVSQENFQEAVAARDRYKTLVTAVRRKTNLGYATPGDLPQIQAEYEGREQQVKIFSTEYLKNLEDLITLLDLEPGTDVTFEVPNTMPKPPTLSQKDPETLRAIKSQKLKVEAADESLTAAKSNSYPFLNFVGQINSTGADESSESSYSEVVGGTRPKYYVGLSLTYNFGSDIQNERIINKKLAKDYETTVLKRQLAETGDLESQAQRRALSAYAVAESAERQKEFRDKAVKDLTKTYNQGRTDISILITAMNNYYNAEVAYLKAVGEYHKALNQWAAVRDELVVDDQATKVEVR